MKRQMMMLAAVFFLTATLGPPAGGIEETAISGTVAEYPDRVGNVILTGKGNQDSRFTVSWTFSGFHVWANPVLSGMMDAGMTAAVDLVSDVYTLYPVSTRVTVHSRMHDTRGNTEWTNTLNRSYASSLPDRDRFEQLLAEKNLPFIPFHIAFSDRRPAGGGCTLELMGHTGAPGVSQPIPYQTSTEGHGSSMVIDHYRNESWSGRSFFNCGISLMRYTEDRCRADSSPCKKGSGMQLQGQGGMWVEFSAPPREVEQEIDLKDIYCSGELEQVTSNSGEQFEMKLVYRFGLKKEIDVTLEPKDGQEFTWLPSPGETRRYKLTLNDPGPEEVEAIRFTLHDTSEHPGVATNAGNHIRGDSCDDCEEGKKSEKRLWETFFSTGADGEPLPIYRIYTQYNDCPVDRLPDLFFNEDENPDFELSEEGKSQELKYEISQGIEKDDEITEETYTAVVSVMDSAASAKLSAEIKWGGVWYEAKAIGRTAADNETRLMIPLDSDEDDLPDSWENGKGVDDPDGDNDSRPEGMFPGDGLTNFEEYRGIYSEGVLTRLWPDYKDVFVYDDSTRYAAQLRQVQAEYDAEDLQLWILEEDEFRDDLINYNEVEHRGGDQYIIVVMGHHSVSQVDMTDASGMASRVGPPIREANTVIIDTSYGDYTWRGADPSKTSLADLLSGESSDSPTELSHFAMTIGHEIGHDMNLPHHGEGERFAEADGRRGWVACIGGEHSGVRDCFMRYNNAIWFIDLEFVPRTTLGRWLSSGTLVPYPDPMGSENMFCDTLSGGDCCGDAEGGGNCLNLLNVRSY